MELGTVIAGWDLLKHIKNQADYLSNITQNVENANEILEAKQHALMLSKEIHMLQQAIHQLVVKNEQLQHALAQQENLELVQFDLGDGTLTTVYKATAKNGVVRHICPCCYEGEGKLITLQQRNEILAAVMDTVTSQQALFCHHCKTHYTTKMTRK